jgi:protocadherin gamma subfamily A/protocadherin delta 1/protocadherin delta 2
VQVNAYDFGNPAQTSSVLVYFNVKDTNDNTPVFEQGIYDVAILENVTVGTSIVQVQAPDVDTGKLTKNVLFFWHSGITYLLKHV